MRTRMKIVSRKFYVNTEKKAVTCVIKVDPSIYSHPCYGLVRDFMLYNSKKLPDLLKDYIFTATAKCSPLDTFDEEKGRRIAESRAKLKAFRFLESSYHKISVALTSTALEFSKTAVACEHSAKTELNHILDISE